MTSASAGPPRSTPHARICVFCGSSYGVHPDYALSAERLGSCLARRGIGLVYGGANVGMMKRLADATLAGGGHVTGVIPTLLVHRELAHGAVHDLRVVASMHERKATMANLADAFVVLAGGLGTFEELFEIVTWAQLGLHRKPIGLVDTRSYYARLGAFLDHAVAEGFIRPENRSLLVVDPDVERLIETLMAGAGLRRPSAVDEAVV